MKQTSFIGGMDLIAPDTEIADSGYQWLINGRQRLGSIECNNKHEEITTVPEGNKQGSISLGNILIVFVSGSAWYNVDETDIWIKIPTFVMDPDVDRYFYIAVPDGTVSYKRKLNPDGNASSSLQKVFDIAINGTPAAILVQDGINQPFVIIYDSTTQTFTARATKTYANWLNDGTHREYVPIGREMLVVDSKLFILSTDRKRMFQSISGRYLDFMINVDILGDKLVTESLGGADSLAFNFDSADITCIANCDVPSSFFYGTEKNLRIITLDYNRTIFDEPIPFVAAQLSVGVVNQDSLTDILGDTAVIDFDGVKSFNAVSQIKFEGDNSIFSLQLSKLLKNIKQTRCRCVNFDNFALFNLDTTWGNLMAVYDTLLEKWVSLDITNVTRVKQFTIVNTSDATKLYALTSEDRLYRMYSSSEKETARVFTRAFAQDPVDGGNTAVRQEQKSEYVKTIFVGGSVESTARLVEFADGRLSKRSNQVLPVNIAGVGPPPIIPPVIPDSQQKEQTVTFAMKGSLRGTKLAYVISWNTDAKLQAMEIMTENNTTNVGSKQANSTYAIHD